MIALLTFRVICSFFIIHPKSIPYPHLCRIEGKEWFSLNFGAETKQVIPIYGSAKL